MNETVMEKKVGEMNLLSLKDLPFSRTTAWRLMRQGKLGYYRINRRIFFSVRHVEEFLENCETPNARRKTDSVKKSESS